MKTHRTILQGTLLVIGALALAAGFIITNHPVTVSAAGKDGDNAVAAYPQIRDTRLDACSLCHTNAPSLNPYGMAYRSNGRNANAFAVVESLDSDGDGFTNIQEINALTFPGDAGDKPVAAPTQTPTRVPTNTPTRIPTNPPTQAPTHTPTNLPTIAPTSAPTATPTQSPTITPTNTAAPTQPPVPTVTATDLPKPTSTAAPETRVIHPSADVYAGQEAKGGRLENGDALLVDSKPKTVSYVRFEVKGADGRGKVTQAILRLYANTSSSAGISVFRAGGGRWDEETAGENAPKFGGSSVRIRDIDGGGWVEIDVTDWIHGKKSVTFAVTTSGSQISFASRETGDHAPQLVITVDERGDHDEDDDGDDDDRDHHEDDDDHEDEEDDD